MKSVIILLFLLLISCAVYSQNERSKIIDVLQTYKKMNQEFINSVNGTDTVKYHQLKSKVEFYSENVYDSILPEMVNLICKKKDSELLKTFIEVLISTQNSADELPAWKLGEIYICQPDLTLSIIKQNKKKNYLIELLRFWFENNTNEKEKSIDNFKELQEKLNKIKMN